MFPGWECHNDVECGRLGKCTELLTPGIDDDDDDDGDRDRDVIVCRVSCLSMSMDYEGTFDDDTTLAMRTMKMKKIMIRTMKMIGKERRSWESQKRN